MLAYAAADGLTVRLDGTEIQVRRLKANRPGRRAFVSGEKKQNTINATVASDAHGRPMWAAGDQRARVGSVMTAAMPSRIRSRPKTNSCSVAGSSPAGSGGVPNVLDEKSFAASG